MNILVTGGAGFVGYHLCKSLLESTKDTIICIDNFSTGINDTHLQYLAAGYKNRFEVKNFDLTTQLPNELASAKHIYHLASIIGMKDSNQGSKKTFDSNIRMMLNIISFAQKHESKVLFTSTNEVYCGADGIIPTVNNTEDSPIGFREPFSPRWSYAASKFACELLLKSSGINQNIVRLSNVYGPRMITSYVVKSFIDQALKNSSQVEIKSSNDTRPFTYVSDTVAGIIKSMNSNYSNEIFNIGNENSVKIIDLAKIIWHEVNPKLKLQLNETTNSKPELRQCNAKKAKQLLNWQAVVSLEEGIQKTVQWYKQ